MYALIMHRLKLLRKIHNSLFCLSIIYFVDGNAWHLEKMVDLDIMVIRNFFRHK